jgi:hypothetical protein
MIRRPRGEEEKAIRGREKEQEEQEWKEEKRKKQVEKKNA